jgi:ribonuclease HII
MAIRIKTGPDFKLESAALKAGANAVCGVDEAGRGPLAGPVVAAAVVLDPANIPPGLNDSKKLTETARENLFAHILATAEVGVGVADVARIDRDNILAATMWAMAEAVNDLATRPDLALVDGNRASRTWLVPASTVVKGDATAVSIAAASIVAKVTRDRIMCRIDADYPGYGFARHKGYGSPYHLDALARLGPCEHHRTSFAPVREALNSTAR